jgi:phospholipase/lecithinase/hemolysin
MPAIARRLAFGLATVVAACALPSITRAANSFDQIVVFGDSVSDVGNGSIIWGPQSSAPWQAAIPQNNYSNNRYTDGPDTQPATGQPAQIWTDRLAAKLNMMAPSASLAGGTDYAAFGAIVDHGSGDYPSLDAQVQQAIGRGVSPNSLYIFWGGANNITNQTDAAVVVGVATAAAQSIAQQIASLAAAGGRYFVWINLPPFDRIPGAASNATLNNAFAQASIAFDQQEASSISQLQIQYQSRGMVIVDVDAYGLFTKILNKPWAYGFTNVTDNAAGQQVNPDVYFFWKGGHFTTTGHVAVANEIYRVVQQEFPSAGSKGPSSGPATGKLDFDGDGRRDYTVWRSSDGVWYMNPNSNPGAPRVDQWGLSSDVPVPGDYDGDGITDHAVWRPWNGTWYVVPSSHPSAAYARQWGLPGDIPVPGDYDGDGKIDFAVWRPSNGCWYVIPSAAPNAPIVTQWGLTGDVVVPGDYDGDRKADYAVWRPANGTWYIKPSANPANPIVQQWGLPGDVPVPGDYDGDGRLDYAIWRPSNGSWYIIQTTNPFNPIVQQWGLPGDIPVYGDFDGDGRTDYAVWRPFNGIWYVIPSSNPSAPQFRQWGLPGDNPL